MPAAHVHGDSKGAPIPVPTDAPGLRQSLHPPGHWCAGTKHVPERLMTGSLGNASSELWCLLIHVM